MKHVRYKLIKLLSKKKKGVIKYIKMLKSSATEAKEDSLLLLSLRLFIYLFDRPEKLRVWN